LTWIIRWAPGFSGIFLTLPRLGGYGSFTTADSELLFAVGPPAFWDGNELLKGRFTGIWSCNSFTEKLDQGQILFSFLLSGLDPLSVDRNAIDYFGSQLLFPFAVIQQIETDRLREAWQAQPLEQKSFRKGKPRSTQCFEPPATIL